MYKRRVLAFFPAILLTIAAGCTTTGSRSAALRAAAPQGSGERPEATWALQQLRDAAVMLHQRLAQEGSDGFLAVRVGADQIEGLFTQSGAERLQMVNVGVAPSEAEPRWVHFRSMRSSPLVGFCARGVRIAEANGPDGLRERALIADRLLLVGSGESAFWGAWVQGLILTEQGWKLLPSVAYSRQVEDPRVNHADVQLWDCDLGQRPLRDHPLSSPTQLPTQATRP